MLFRPKDMLLRGDSCWFSKPRPAYVVPVNFEAASDQACETALDTFCDLRPGEGETRRREYVLQ